jgi:hypothetical protein
MHIGAYDDAYRKIGEVTDAYRRLLAGQGEHDDESTTDWWPCAAKGSADGDFTSSSVGVDTSPGSAATGYQPLPAKYQKATTAWGPCAAQESSESAPPLPVAARPTSPPLMVPKAYACPSCDDEFVKWSVCLNHVKITITCKQGPDGRDLSLDPNLQYKCKAHAVKLMFGIYQ